MSGVDREELPKALRARLARHQAGGGPTTSLLPVPGAAGLRSVGLGADGAIVGSMELRQWVQKIDGPEVPCVGATVFGTAIARFHAERWTRVDTLAIMPLEQR
jgi:hypothetical protein